MQSNGSQASSMLRRMLAVSVRQSFETSLRRKKALREAEKKKKEKEKRALKRLTSMVAEHRAWRQIMKILPSWWDNAFCAFSSVLYESMLSSTVCWEASSNTIRAPLRHVGGLPFGSWKTRAT